MIDDRTSSLNLPLPHQSNTLDVDVLRLRAALTTIDAETAQVKANAESTTAELNSAKDDLLGKADVQHTHDYGSLTGLPPLASAIQNGLMSKEDVLRIQENAAAIQSLIGGLRMRGIVLSAFSPIATNVLTHVAITNPGAGYVAGEVFYVNLPGVTEIPAWFIVNSVDASGAISSVEIVNSGAFSDISAPETASVTTGVTGGSGAAFLPIFAAGMGETLSDLSQPMKGDAAVVLHDDVTGGAWMWIFADQNGDGVANWIPSGGPMGANRNFFLNPIAGDEIDRSLLLPPGSVIYFSANVVPSGFLRANGAVVSRTAYAELFSIIGTTYGTGDGINTFNLPDLRGEFIRSWDNGRGIDASRSFGVVQGQSFLSHAHPYLDFSNRNATETNYTLRVSISSSGNRVFLQQTSDTSAAGGNETRPRNFSLLAVIKY
jgi:microcystin-dependent protein